MNQYFEILELQPGATPEEVKTAYRDLAKVWHPDRFKEDSPRLKAKAAEKLAEINEAYEKIRTYQARNRARRQANPGPDESGHVSGYRPYTPRPGATDAGQSFTGYNRPTQGGGPRRSDTGSARPPSSPYRSGRQSASARSASGASSSGYGRPAQSPYHDSGGSFNSLTHRPSRVQYGPAYRRRYKYSRKRKRSGNTVAMYLAIVAVLAVTVAGTIFFINRSKVNQPLTLSEMPFEQPAQATVAVSEAGNPVGEDPGAGLDSAHTLQQPSDIYEPSSRSSSVWNQRGGPVEPGNFTLGSTRAEVRTLQGEPEQVRTGVFRYGFSQVYFKDGVVSGWHQSPGDVLNVQLSPKKAYEVDYFTVGSGRDQVIAIQGTPDHYGDGGRELRYGESRITFQDDVVVNWYQHANAPLKARLIPEVVSTATHFSLGSTKDEVVSVQGTPDHFSENIFHYGHSVVDFEDGLVVGWNEATNAPLKVELLPSNPTSTKFFTKGSTRDEVIAAQGTPDQYSERMLKYGYSTISFEDGKVVGWYESAPNKLNAREETQ